MIIYKCYVIYKSAFWLISEGGGREGGREGGRDGRLTEAMSWGWGSSISNVQGRWS